MVAEGVRLPPRYNAIMQKQINNQINNQLIMEISVKKQTAKVGVAGSFFNQMMSNNSSVPVVGKGATQMHYTDRTCYEVVEVSADGKSARLEYLNAEWNKSLGGGQGHQNWILKPTGRFVTIVWRHNAWRKVGTEIWFTDEFVKDCESKGINFIGMYLRKNNPELADKIWGTEGSPRPVNVVDGYTKMKKTYNKINILFGIKDYYYDWEF